MPKEFINYKTGEVILKDIGFVKMHRGHNVDISSLKSSDRKMLDHFLDIMNRGNKVVFTTEDRANLAKDLGVGVQTITNRIASLRKIDVIASKYGGTYMVNPAAYSRVHVDKLTQLIEKYEELK